MNFPSPLSLAKAKLKKARLLPKSQKEDSQNIEEITSLAKCLIRANNLENPWNLNPKAFELFLSKLTPSPIPCS